MGARMLRDQLHRQGVKAGRRHIGTLMLRMGITALAPQPGTSKRAPKRFKRVSLLRRCRFLQPHRQSDRVHRQ